MPLIDAYLQLLHKPAATERWRNDAWLVPLTLDRDHPHYEVKDLTDVLPAGCLLGYDPFFVEIFGRFTVRHHDGEEEDLSRTRRALQWTKNIVSHLRDTGWWIDKELVVVEARLYAKWVLADQQDEEQGMGTLAPTYDYQSLLDMDFDPQEIEMSGSPGVRLELQEGRVPLRRLARYMESLSLGRVKIAYLVSIYPDSRRPDNRNRDVSDTWFKLLDFFPLRSGFPKKYGETVELGVRVTEAEHLVDGATTGKVILTSDIDPDASPRHVLFPPGVTYPDAWISSKVGT